MSEPTYAEVREHKGHNLTVESDDVTANIICDDCGEILLSAREESK